MGNNIVDNIFGNIANTIRGKLGVDSSIYKIKPLDFANEINALPQSNAESEYLDISSLIDGTLSSITLSKIKQIPSSTFIGCNNLTTVNFPNCVAVGYEAFTSCSNLAQVSMPEVRFISTGGFEYCSKLASIEFPKCVGLSNSIFWGCTNIVNISLPKCRKIYSEVFMDITTTNNSIYNHRAIFIPNIECISSGAFTYRSANVGDDIFSHISFPRCSCFAPGGLYTRFKSISLPECSYFWMDGPRYYSKISSLTSLDDLSQLYLPKLRYIGGDAFKYYSTLSIVNLPELRSMDSYTTSCLFYGCSNLAVISMPKLSSVSGFLCAGDDKSKIVSYSALLSIALPNLTTITNGFYNCPNLSNIYFGKKHINLSISSSTDKLFNYCSNLEHIGFSNTLDNNVININNFYGANNSKLSEIVLPITSALSLSSCSNIAKIVLFSSNCALTLTDTPITNSTYKGSFGSIYVQQEHLNNYKAIYSSYADRFVALDSIYSTFYTYPNEFKNNSSITAIPQSKVDTTHICEYAFTSCAGLTEVTLSKTTFIDNYAFASCQNLTNIILPMATFIGTGAFSGCSNLLQISFPNAEVLNACAFYDCSSLGNISGQVVRDIGSNCFYRNINLISANFPEAINIYNYAFGGCSNLASILLPKAEVLDYRAFEACSSLVNINLPQARILDGYLFSNCRNLSYVSIPNISYIPQCCFYNCTALCEVPNYSNIVNIDNTAFYNTGISVVKLLNVFNIGHNAFNSCKSLSKVIIGAGALIDQRAFGNCSILSTIYLSNDTILLNSAFYNCSNLKSVYFCGNDIITVLPSYSAVSEADPFKDCSSDLTIFVRQSLLSAYIASPFWYANRDRFIGMSEDTLVELYSLNS